MIKDFDQKLRKLGNNGVMMLDRKLEFQKLKKSIKNG